MNPSDKAFKIILWGEIVFLIILGCFYWNHEKLEKETFLFNSIPSDAVESGTPSKLVIPKWAKDDGLRYPLLVKQRKVTVFGAVHRQGEQVIPEGKSLMLSQAILQAGGVSDQADLRRVVVIRKNPEGKPENTRVDLRAVMSEKVEKDFELQNGDAVLVKERKEGVMPLD